MHQHNIGIQIRKNSSWQTCLLFSIVFLSMYISGWLVYIPLRWIEDLAVRWLYLFLRRDKDIAKPNLRKIFIGITVQI
jgi:hypothetical protein